MNAADFNDCLGAVLAAATWKPTGKTVGADGVPVPVAIMDGFLLIQGCPIRCALLSDGSCFFNDDDAREMLRSLRGAVPS